MSECTSTCPVVPVVCAGGLAIEARAAALLQRQQVRGELVVCPRESEESERHSPFADREGSLQLQSTLTLLAAR
eukprot:COSAG04_NODE_2136_length_4725_cov_8.089710_4_plen_74_part_00